MLIYNYVYSCVLIRFYFYFKYVFSYCFDPGFSGVVKVSVKFEVNLDPSKKLALSLYHSSDPRNPKRKKITNGDEAFSTVLSSNLKPDNKV